MHEISPYTHKARILIFAKAPIPGFVKTRLIPELGEEGAAQLHEKLLWQNLETVVKAALCPVEIWCYPNGQYPTFTHARTRFNIITRNQDGIDLGERMHNAFQYTLTKCDYALIIGTDCPSLTSDDLSQALLALESGYNAVLGPAEDGGYVLIGLRNTASCLFKDINWGSDQVLAQTRHKLRTLKWSWKELVTRWDVDRPEDLARISHQVHAP